MSYSHSTGLLVLDISKIDGSGTFSSWTTNLDGAAGGNGSSGTSGSSGSSGTSGLLALTGTTNNGIITLDGAAPNGNVESNLRFDGSILSVDGRIIASGSTTSDLVRITQTGAGNAFVVEDSANPDTSMFVITSAGDVGIGATTPTSKLYVAANNTQTYAIQGLSTILGGYGGKFFGYNGGFFEGAGNGAGTSTLSYGLFASAHDSITNIAVLGIADNNESYIATTNIGGHFIAENAVNNYSLRLQDGTAGINKLLVDVTGNGEANWTSSIKVTSIIASASSTSDLVLITQGGSGNALVVQDSLNNDGSHFVVDGSGNVVIGATATTYKLDVVGNTRIAGNIYGTNSNNTIVSDALIQAGLLFLSNNC